MIGNRYPLKIIPKELLDNLGLLKNRIKFTKDDLDDLGIEPSALKPFVLDLTYRDQLVKMKFGLPQCHHQNQFLWKNYKRG